MLDYESFDDSDHDQDSDYEMSDDGEKRDSDATELCDPANVATAMCDKTLYYKETKL